MKLLISEAILYFLRYIYAKIITANIVWTCNVLTDVSSVKNLLETIRGKRDKWQLSHRRKNVLALAGLGVDEEIALDTIYQKLSYRDYSSGPLPDDHRPPIPGEVWIFGFNISDELCYLKFQNRPNGIVIWISLHQAEYPLEFPFKNI
mgnify:CR=1 FL=1